VLDRQASVLVWSAAWSAGVLIRPTCTGVGEKAGLSALSSVCSSCNSDLKIRSDVRSAGRAGQLIASEHQDHHDGQDQPVSGTEIGQHRYLHMQLVTLR
jgi:hypothetical protein